MKKKIGKIVIPIFISILCGFVCGRVMFSIYEDKGSDILDSKSVYLLLCDTYNGRANDVAAGQSSARL